MNYYQVVRLSASRADNQCGDIFRQKSRTCFTHDGPGGTNSRSHGTDVAGHTIQLLQSLPKQEMCAFVMLSCPKFNRILIV